MSSYRLGLFRKRASDETSFDDSSPPVKKLRVCNREKSMFPFCLVASKYKKIIQWVSELPVNTILKEKMIRRSLHHQPADIVDDDEKDVINIDDEVEADISILNDEDVCPSKENVHKENTFSNDSFKLSRPLSSTPFYRTAYRLNEVNGKAKSSISKQSNGMHLRPSKLTSITGHGNDIEVLLDTSKIPAEVHNEPEVSVIGRPFKNSRRTLSPMHKFGQVLKSSPDNLAEKRPCVAFYKERVRTPHSTVHEVERLEEKAKYQLLLDKMVSGSSPIYHPLRPIKECTFTIDLTEDDDLDEPVLLNPPFRKEIVKYPLQEYMEKFYKPYNYRPLSPKSHESSSKASTADDKEVLNMTQIKLPEYKPNPKKRPDFCSREWIDDLKASINEETEKVCESIKRQNDKLELFWKKKRKEKLAEQSWLKDQLKLSSAIFYEAVEEKQEFPDITPEMEEKIAWAFAHGNPAEKLSRLDNLDITRGDIATLQDQAWLNDQVINFYVAMIVERSKLDNYPSIYAYNSFFYPTLKARGENAVLRWTRKVDVFSYDYLLVPIHLGLHWTLVMVDNGNKVIRYYDSLSSSEEISLCLQLVQHYLCTEMKDKKKQVMNPNEYRMESLKDIPHQLNGSDCGMFTLKYAEYLSRDAPLTFSQTNMKYFRRRMVYEILTRKII